MPALIGRLEPTRVARADLYLRDWALLKVFGRPEDISLANEIERAIIDEDGFPPGCFSLSPRLQLFSTDEWHEIIKWLEEGIKGSTSIALQFIEYQMAFQLHECPTQNDFL